MRIAIATFAALPSPAVRGGAVETLIDILCDENAKTGYLDIDVYSPFDRDAELSAQGKEHVNYYYYSRKKHKKLSLKAVLFKLTHISLPDCNMKRLIRMINQRNYDFVVITSINYEMQFVFPRIRSRVIWYLHGDPISVISKQKLRQIANSCEGILTVSDFIRNRIGTVQPRCKVVTVRNCSNLCPVEIHRAAEARNQTRGGFGIRNEDVVFAYIGRITPIKGVMELIAAFQKDKDARKKLLVVGSPSNQSEEEYYQQLQQNEDERIRFISYIPHNQLNQIYNAADCIVLPSICQEAAPLIALEAQNCGTPLIATKIGGIPEYADDNTVLVDFDEAFVERLTTAISDFQVSETLRSNKILYSTRNYYTDFYRALNEMEQE